MTSLAYNEERLFTKSQGLQIGVFPWRWQSKDHLKQSQTSTVVGAVLRDATAVDRHDGHTAPRLNLCRSFWIFIIMQDLLVGDR